MESRFINDVLKAHGYENRCGGLAMLGTRTTPFRHCHAHLEYDSQGVEYFVSYYTLVAVRLPDDTLLFNGDTYSVTTTQQIYKWCGIPTAERRKGMKEGIYGTFYTHGYNVF